ncbi:MAG: hypothetical protein JO267_04910 [Alphaproteobacteria bacterium]|nr:hypothetical protein [Alphaproteobacteria bacterium]
MHVHLDHERCMEIAVLKGVSALRQAHSDLATPTAAAHISRRSRHRNPATRCPNTPRKKPAAFRPKSAAFSISSRIRSTARKRSSFAS